jgi:hypothetical protein
MKGYLYYYKNTLLIGINRDKEEELRLVFFLIMFLFGKCHFLTTCRKNNLMFILIDFLYY